MTPRTAACESPRYARASRARSPLEDVFVPSSSCSLSNAGGRRFPRWTLEGKFQRREPPPPRTRSKVAFMTLVNPVPRFFEEASSRRHARGDFHSFVCGPSRIIQSVSFSSSGVPREHWRCSRQLESVDAGKQHERPIHRVVFLRPRSRKFRSQPFLEIGKQDVEHFFVERVLVALKHECDVPRVLGRLHHREELSAGRPGLFARSSGMYQCLVGPSSWIGSRGSCSTARSGRAQPES